MGNLEKKYDLAEMRVCVCDNAVLREGYVFQGITDLECLQNNPV